MGTPTYYAGDYMNTPRGAKEKTRLRKRGAGRGNRASKGRNRPSLVDKPPEEGRYYIFSSLSRRAENEIR